MLDLILMQEVVSLSVLHSEVKVKSTKKHLLIRFPTLECGTLSCVCVHVCVCAVCIPHPDVN